MDLEKRINAFVKLGNIFRDPGYEGLENVIKTASKQNGWFTVANIRLAIASLGTMLEEEKIREWIGRSGRPQLQGANPKSQISNRKSEGEQPGPKKIGVIMAGNIPLVGFHDFLCVLITGNTFVGKLSSEDEALLPAISKLLITIEPGFKNKIQFIDQPFNKTKGITAFIATGSNNSARYFEYYFKKYPHIIRKNRNAVAILDGTETKHDLKDLGNDVFQYFGMGCRSVSKIYIPEDYKLDTFFEAIADYSDVINHNKYANNHSYHQTIYLLNSEKFLDNNFLMLKESEQIASPVATLYYERYKSKKELLKKLESQHGNIQCVVTNAQFQASSFKLQTPNLSFVPFGQSQSPELWDYADGIDTLKFLISLQ